MIAEKKAAAVYDIVIMTSSKLNSIESMIYLQLHVKAQLMSWTSSNGSNACCIEYL